MSIEIYAEVVKNPDSKFKEKHQALFYLMS